MRERLLSSRTILPFQPGWMSAAVEWTMMPSRPNDERPSSRPAMSSGSSTHSNVVARANSPG